MKQYVSVAAFLAFSTAAFAGPKERDLAYRIHDRLAGVPPSSSILTAMEELIVKGDIKAAAMMAMDNDNFLRVTVQDLAAPWSNEEDRVGIPLNDYTATIVGMVRDNKPFNEVLSHNYIYRASDTVITNNAIDPYSMEDNSHYEQFELLNLPYNAANLVEVPQNTVQDLGVAAGIITTRQFGSQYFNAGTNRAPVRENLKTFLCRDIETLPDNTRPDSFVRQDVPRDPGGEPETFIRKCSGCHAGLDPLSQAFAYFDYNTDAQPNRVSYTPGQVVSKVTRNADVFPAGYVTQSDSWMNLWTEGVNANIGWRGAKTGTGPTEFGAMLTDTDSFESCMATRVFDNVCSHAPESKDDLALVDKAAKAFAESNHNMKSLFAEISSVCLQNQAMVEAEEQPQESAE